MSAMTLTAQTSKPHSNISTPRLTPLRMIERNRNTDKNDISRLESKIKALESEIIVAKQIGEDKKLDKLQTSLNTSLPPCEDQSLLTDGVNDEEKVLLGEELNFENIAEKIGSDMKNEMQEDFANLGNQQMTYNDQEQRLMDEICGLKDKLKESEPISSNIQIQRLSKQENSKKII